MNPDLPKHAETYFLFVPHFPPSKYLYKIDTRLSSVVCVVSNSISMNLDISEKRVVAGIYVIENIYSSAELTPTLCTTAKVAVLLF